MSRSARAIAASAALLFSLHMVSLHGQGKGAKPAPAPHAAKTATAKPQAPKPAAPKAGAMKPQAPKASTRAGAATTPAAAKTKPSPATPSTKSAKQNTDTTKPSAKAGSAKTANADKKALATEKKSASAKKPESKKAAKTATATTPTTPAIPFENMTPIQQKLSKNSNLSSKLQARLPAGTSLMEASDGFRNLGQFVAAVNVSSNLKIPFDQLKTDMVTKKMSLGQSIQDLRPLTSSATVEAQRAEYDAGSLIAETEHETSLSATGSTVVTTSSKTTATAAKPQKASRKTTNTGGF